MLHEAQRARPMSCPFIRPQWLVLAIPCHPPGCLASLEKGVQAESGLPGLGLWGCLQCPWRPRHVPPTLQPSSLHPHPAWGASCLMAIRAFLILKDPCSGFPARCVEAGAGGKWELELVGAVWEPVSALFTTPHFLPLSDFSNCCCFCFLLPPLPLCLSLFLSFSSLLRLSLPSSPLLVRLALPISPSCPPAPP